MIPTKSVRKQLGELLAADATTLAPPADANVVRLIVEPFTPDENLVPGDLTFASFNGSTALAAGTGTQPCGIDPATGQQIVTIKEPAGGWRWECGATPSPAQTVYGYALLNDDSTVLLGVGVLDDPVAITEAGQEINLGTVKFTLNEAPIS